MTEHPNTQPSHVRRAGVVQLLVVVLGLALGASASVSGPPPAAPDPFPSALAEPDCGPGALRETGRDGRVPSSDYSSGRYKQGYRCNTDPGLAPGRHRRLQGGAVRRPGGPRLRVLRLDAALPQGHPDAGGHGARGRRARHDEPGRTREDRPAHLPAMLSPHESLLLNAKRGHPRGRARQPGDQRLGVLDLYDVQHRLPPPEAALEHADRRARPRERVRARREDLLHHRHGRQHLPGRRRQRPDRSRRCCSRQYGVNYHGVRVSDDGRRSTSPTSATPRPAASPAGDCGSSTSARSRTRKADPQVPVLSVADLARGLDPAGGRAVHRNGHQYLLEFDEYANYARRGRRRPRPAPRWAPRGSSTSRTRATRRWSPTSGSPCTSPRRARATSRTTPAPTARSRGTPPTTARCRRGPDPNLVACSMILSGLRIFDIRDVAHPKEVGYFNQPVAQGDNPLGPRRRVPSRCPSPPGTRARLGLVLRRQLRLLRRAADQRAPGPVVSDQTRTDEILETAS